MIFIDIKNKAKRYWLTSLVFLFILGGVVVADSLMPANHDFFQGVIIGMIAAWIALTFDYIREKKNPRHQFDERMKHIVKSAASYSLFISLFIGMTALLFLGGFGIEIKVNLKVFLVVVLEVLVLSYFFSFLIISRKH